MNLENSQQYRTFLEELRDLAEFRQDYALDHPAAGLDGQDPDVKRIIEAMAFFSARTRIALNRSLDAGNQRLYQQFFSFLLTPLPSMAMVQAIPTGTLTEVLNLPAGTEIALQPTKGGLVIFNTTQAMRILPMSLVQTKQDLSVESGSRLLLSFKANYRLNEQPETLRLHINYLNDLSLSLKVLQFFGMALQKVSVQFDEYDQEQPTLPCGFSLGTLPLDIADDQRLQPMELERQYFHFPQQELYLQVELPAAPRNWRQFTVILDCDRTWPRHLRINSKLFQLFTVPLVNNQRAMAQPIMCDGTQEHYTIRHPEPELGFCLQKVLGVYEVGEQGLSPLRPGVLSGGNGSYEIEQGPMQEYGGYLYRLVPHFPASFEQPRTLVIEALWQQPWYDQILPNPHTLQVFRRQIQGLQWELTDTAIAHAENPQLHDINRYLHLLTLMHKVSLGAQDVKDLLSALGSVSAGQFQKVFNNLVDVRLEEEPGEGYKNKQIYYLQFKPQAVEFNEMLGPFAHHVGRVLDLWLSDAKVEAAWEILDELNDTNNGVNS